MYITLIYPEFANSTQFDVCSQGKVDFCMVGQERVEAMIIRNEYFEHGQEYNFVGDEGEGEESNDEDEDKDDSRRRRAGNCTTA